MDAIVRDLEAKEDVPEKDALEELFLTPSPALSSEWLNRFQPELSFDDPAVLEKLIQLPGYESQTQLKFKRVGLEGRITHIEETVPSFVESGGAHALSLTRQMGARKDQVRGRSGRMPFTPGGLEIHDGTSKKDLHRSHQGLYDVAPGLSRGLSLPTPGDSDIKEMAPGDADESESDEDEDNSEGERYEEDVSEETEVMPKATAKTPTDAEIDTLLPDSITFMRKTASTAPVMAKKEWAHMVDVNQPFDNFNELVPNPARTWPFELDNFQKEAVFHLEQGDSVFVAAHTSAGKTVIAEYAMSMAVKHMTKCIYTSPIKALSNQKYRDFSREYDDVGILTGDVQLNPEATTLIMTTEILRSMLYRGADIIRDVEFIIFDEVHYVNDSDRGVVWEEVIIMLPEHVKLILLSATVPNTFEFANWVGRTKEKNVYVIATPKRPVPLKHYLWAKKKMFEIVNENRKFNEVGWRACSNHINPPPPEPPKNSQQSGGRGGSNARGGNNARGGGAVRGRGKNTLRGGAAGNRALQVQQGPQRGRFNNNAPGKSTFVELISHLKKEKLLPAVVFVFSRKMVEQHASSLQSMELNTGREKAEVYMFVDQAIARLRQEDRDLPQIQILREMLMRGVGIHHSGLLPILKEVVEILFAKGLVKLLFATETFAMGLNLPTRTVVFSALRKFDSKNMRNLTPGEYTQMAGRAGRRGLDKVGTVIIINTGDGVMPQSMLQSVILGTPTKLSSQFRLTYTMILSLLRIEAVKVEDVIKQSFSENATYALRPEREKEMLLLQSRLVELQESKEYKSLPQVYTDLWYMCQEYSQLTTQIYTNILLSKKLSTHLVIYRSEEGLRRAGMILSSRRDPLVVLRLAYGGRNQNELPLLPFSQEFAQVPQQNLMRKSFHDSVPVSNIEVIGAASLKKEPTVDSEKLKEAQRLLLDNGESFEEINVTSTKAVEARLAVGKRDQCEKKLREQVIPQIKGTKSSVIRQNYMLAGEVGNLEQQMSQLKLLSVSQNTELLPDYEQRLNVLKEANYIDANLNVLLKGRVACEITTGFEMYVTELILDNFLASYEPEEIVALLSAFVFEGMRGVEDADHVTPKLDRGKAQLLKIVNYVHSLSEANQVPLTMEEEEFAERGRFGLMAAVYEWARGMSFSEITSLVDVQEGIIVRVINRLDEVCRAVMSAARIIGDVDLYDKVSLAQERIKRDIVFCSSLYL